jgi:uncharacterized membrane protein
VFTVTTTIERLGVLAVAILVLIAFLWWSYRTTSRSFFRGVLAGTGLVLAFDIIWIHWIFGLHHLTNAPEDVVLEPALVVAGVIFLWFGITNERRGGP